MTMEPPTGLRSNLLRTYAALDNKVLNDCKKVDAYKKRVYSKDINILKNGEVEIEAQRYLTFHFDIDYHNHLMMSSFKYYMI